MTRRLAVIAIAIRLPLAARLPKPDKPVVTTERVPFAPGSTIQVTGSLGELNIEGWDRAEIETTVTRSTLRTHTPPEQDLVRRHQSAYNGHFESICYHPLLRSIGRATVWPPSCGPGTCTVRTMGRNSESHLTVAVTLVACRPLSSCEIS